MGGWVGLRTGGRGRGWAGAGVVCRLTLVGPLLGCGGWAFSRLGGLRVRAGVFGNMLNGMRPSKVTLIPSATKWVTEGDVYAALGGHWWLVREIDGYDTYDKECVTIHFVGFDSQQLPLMVALHRYPNGDVLVFHARKPSKQEALMIETEVRKWN